MPAAAGTRDPPGRQRVAVPAAERAGLGDRALRPVAGRHRAGGDLPAAGAGDRRRARRESRRPAGPALQPGREVRGGQSGPQPELPPRLRRAVPVRLRRGRGGGADVPRPGLSERRRLRPRPHPSRAGERADAGVLRARLFGGQPAEHGVDAEHLLVLQRRQHLPPHGRGDEVGLPRRRRHDRVRAPAPLERRASLPSVAERRHRLQSGPGQGRRRERPELLPGRRRRRRQREQPARVRAAPLRAASARGRAADLRAPRPEPPLRRRHAARAPSPSPRRRARRSWLSSRRPARRRTSTTRSSVTSAGRGSRFGTSR